MVSAGFREHSDQVHFTGSMATCYMCARPATSMEHVPPKGLFPKTKDLPGGSLRQGLITVPSCDLHNTSKSDDDEFLMVSLAGIIGNNSIGYAHKFGKVNRAIRRSSGRLLDKVFTKKKVFSVDLSRNEFMEVIWGTPDVPRLARCFDGIVRGLHWHHFKTMLEGETKTHLGYLRPEEKNATSFRDFIKHRAELELRGKPRFGNNPDVFFYQITDPDSFGLYLFHLCFYGGLSVYSAVVPVGARPFHLGFALLNDGIKTTVTLEDKEYVFNDDNDDARHRNRDGT